MQWQLRISTMTKELVCVKVNAVIGERLTAVTKLRSNVLLHYRKTIHVAQYYSSFQIASTIVILHKQKDELETWCWNTANFSEMHWKIRSDNAMTFKACKTICRLVSFNGCKNQHGNSFIYSSPLFQKLIEITCFWETAPGRFLEGKRNCTLCTRIWNWSHTYILSIKDEHTLKTGLSMQSKLKSAFTHIKR